MAVKWLSYISEKEDLYIQHARNGGEKRFSNYSLDGYCEETLTAYEFQGCFWHGKDFCDVTYANYGKNMNIVFFSFLGCPECYKDRDIVNPISQKTMEQLYKDTVRKVNYLKKRGLEVEQKWECELKKELEEEESSTKSLIRYSHVMHFTEDVRTLRNYSTSVKGIRRLSKY